MGGKPVMKRMSWRGVRGSEERLDASDPQKPPPMNYSATSTLLSLLNPPRERSGVTAFLEGDEGESDRR